ncbi:Enoyl-CoA hydratase/carnithine racemase [Archaeoglobus sulfaticallidus PM70-1]|uniref:Enoyl-CoA hydratase/carnithine racemase n=1 Tax=Archaeoglobus sulfaticallidus PM70-1 TaxID=387631 RepID=N0BM66_9EURY|nr:enoyl-CoA hydratase/isomerase family protein [Archaeoglobus sulfaticallidus]AGK61701.1 Enoyl-CoA hydratase/carnithine racemase [Archaeoglobus sulfaticallidus PM70-1]
MSAVVFEKSDGILIARLNRPNAFNALNEEVVDGLEELIRKVRTEKDIRAVIITGSGRAFSAGADIKMFLRSETFQARDIIERLGRVLEEFEDLDVPIIAAINGFALGGGCELAMACDMIIASENAVFGQPEINIGIIPGAGGTQRLARLIGWKKAMEYCLTGEKISAKEAEKLGLVNKVVKAEELEKAAMELARTIAEKSPTAVMLVKQAVNRGYKMSLKDGLAYERDLFALAFSSEDAKEGFSAFVEKRMPNFKKKRT